MADFIAIFRLFDVNNNSKTKETLNKTFLATFNFIYRFLAQFRLQLHDKEGDSPFVAVWYELIHCANERSKPQQFEGLLYEDDTNRCPISLSETVNIFYALFGYFLIEDFQKFSKLYTEAKTGGKLNFMHLDLSDFYMMVNESANLQGAFRNLCKGSFTKAYEDYPICLGINFVENTLGFLGSENNKPVEEDSVTTGSFELYVTGTIANELKFLQDHTTMQSLQYIWS